MFSVIVADDHAIVREGLKSLLSAMDEVSVVAEVANGGALGERLAQGEADLLVLDLGMPGVAGTQTIADLKSRAPRLKILVLTANTEPRTAQAVMDAGADGYVTKGGDPAEIAAAISAIRDGGRYLSRSVDFVAASGGSGRRLPNAAEIVSPIALTSRERQVLALIARGLTTREVAGRLNVSFATARKHRENLMQKLGVHGVAELTAYAVRLGVPTA